VPNLKNCNLYYEDSPDYLVEYRGDFEAEIDKISYACGDKITNTIGVVSTSPEYLDQLLKDVPSIIFIDPRSKFVLQDISSSSVDNINAIKGNPYLDLTGRGVLVGMVDTGIDYLNEEFIREDDTSRVLNIWDQTIQDKSDKSVYIGKTYSNEEINNAINAYRNKEDPYKIVISKDDIGHGTKIAGIIGARGYNKEIEGIAPNCDFVVVKLFESINFKNELEGNNVKYTPIYNNAEVLAAVEYLRKYAITADRAMVIYLGTGTTEGSHDGNNLISRYLTSISNDKGIVIVTGVGNEGASEGHASGNITQVKNVDTIELRIPREIKSFSFNIWVEKPNRLSLNVISPNGESSDFIKAVKNRIISFNFIFFKAQMTVKYYSPEQFTGNEAIKVIFNDIKAGIWIFQLRGDYITNGKYNIWLPPQKTLPEDTKFLQSDPFVTLTIPSTARNVATVAYNGNNNALLASSGKGFSSDNMQINPYISTIGVNILTTKPLGGITTISGSSAATAIIVGACALLLQWGIINGNNKNMYSTTIISYLIHGADRNNRIYAYPNREIGYGFFDLLGTFNIISSSYRRDKQKLLNNNFIEYHVNKLLIRIPKYNMEELK
jgi:subtilisin family serine protease